MIFQITKNGRSIIPHAFASLDEAADALRKTLAKRGAKIIADERDADNNGHDIAAMQHGEMIIYSIDAERKD